MSKKHKQSPTDKSADDQSPEDSMDLVQKLEEIEQKSAQYLQGWQRAQADYQNLQKEVEKWKTEFANYAHQELVEELLPIYRNYKVALDHIPDNDKQQDWVQGVQHIYKQLEDFFQKMDVQRIKTIGQEFNPDLHEAVGHEFDPQQDEDIILSETQSGFTMKDKVISPAKVIVNKPIEE